MDQPPAVSRALVGIAEHPGHQDHHRHPPRLRLYVGKLYQKKWTSSRCGAVRNCTSRSATTSPAVRSLSARSRRCWPSRTPPQNDPGPYPAPEIRLRGDRHLQFAAVTAGGVSKIRELPTGYRLTTLSSLPVSFSTSSRSSTLYHYNKQRKNLCDPHKSLRCILCFPAHHRPLPRKTAGRSLPTASKQQKPNPPSSGSGFGFCLYSGAFALGKAGCFAGFAPRKEPLAVSPSAPKHKGRLCSLHGRPFAQGAAPAQGVRAHTLFRGGRRRPAGVPIRPGGSCLLPPSPFRPGGFEHGAADFAHGDVVA